MTPIVVQWIDVLDDVFGWFSGSLALGGSVLDTHGHGHTHPGPITRVPDPPSSTLFTSQISLLFLRFFLLICFSINQNLRFRFNFEKMFTINCGRKGRELRSTVSWELYKLTSHVFV